MYGDEPAGPCNNEMSQRKMFPMVGVDGLEPSTFTLSV